MRRVRLRDVALPRSLLCRLPAARCVRAARALRVARFRAFALRWLHCFRSSALALFVVMNTLAGKQSPRDALWFRPMRANFWQMWPMRAASSVRVAKREAQASGRGRHFSPFVSLTTTSSDVRSSRPFCRRRRLLCCFSCPVLHLEPQDEELSLRALCDTPTVRCAC